MKSTLKKYSPKRENINLGWLNKHLTDPELWKWNKKSIAKAFAIGLFCAFLPVPIHMLLAGILAVSFSANIMLSLLIVWVNNPITIVPIIYFTYKLGASIIGVEIDPEFEFSFGYLMDNFWSATLALWIGGLITSILMATLGYFSIISIYKFRALKRVKRWK
ncbi:MAG: hypothetical protein ACI9GY_000594 [Brevundimonas sp.]|jgi:uncharacterized protein (DUF2062 family)|tara:strand:+ start:1061 stop:1546 length:486 start_codon:yes stop_codon:yes gene_type:complete